MAASRATPPSRPRRWRRLLPVVAAGATMAVACGPSPAGVGPATLVVGVAQGPSAAETSLSRVAALLGRATLLRLDRDCRVLPGLALGVTPSDDALTWTLQLRKGLTFHDGSALDATTVSELLGPATGATADALPPGLRDVARITVPDAVTVRIDLRAPSALLPEALAALEVTGGADNAVTAGPFVTERTGAEELSLRAFDDFHLGRPAIDRIVLRAYPTTRTAWAALMRSEIDFLYEVPAEALPFVESSDSVQVHDFLRPFVHVLGFNLRHPALRDASTRRTLAAAVDRAALVRLVLRGRGLPARDPVWPLHWARTPDGAIDTDAATGDRAARDGPPGLAQRLAHGTASGRVTLGCLLPAGVPAFERLALALQRDLHDAGIDLRLDPVPLGELGRRLARGEFDTYLLELNAFGLGWTYWLWHSEASRPFLDSGYRAADGVLDAMRRARGEAELRAAVAAVQRQLQADPPAIFLYWTRTARAVTTRFALPESTDRDIIASVARWHVAPPVR